MIKIYDRQKKEYFIEKVSGEKSLKFLYESMPGQLLLHTLVKRAFFQNISGSFLDTFLSKRLIKGFIENYNINMDEAIKKRHEFTSFNDFFIRQLKDGVRPMDKDEKVIVSPGDGRILIKKVNLDEDIIIKGIKYNIRDLMVDGNIYDTQVILRLNPTDYHRFHYPISGTRSKVSKIDGYYYSVNPIALNKYPNVFLENKKDFFTMKNNNIDSLLFIAVGATNVGSINIYNGDKSIYVTKGQEAGFFKFGGSTIILFLNSNNIKFDNDLMEQSSKGFETKVLMGESIGRLI